MLYLLSRLKGRMLNENEGKRLMDLVFSLFLMGCVQALVLAVGRIFTQLLASTEVH